MASESASIDSASSDDVQAVKRLREARDRIVGELRKTIVGMEKVVDEMNNAYIIAKKKQFRFFWLTH